ncbi:hypothetical protein ACIBIZ_22975 [Nonomuraea spiralis]|uniref:hypothetical protein n=1 Tax=Nonomuraea TaxID=83681 RepID=UPI00163C554D|nr:hypothetical protein [Nonomuraea sp. WAC 01424]
MTLYSILDRSLLRQGSGAAAALRDTVAFAPQARHVLGFRHQLLLGARSHSMDGK